MLGQCSPVSTVSSVRGLESQRQKRFIASPQRSHQERRRPPSLIDLGHRKLLYPVVTRPEPEAACFRQCRVKVMSL